MHKLTYQQIRERYLSFMKRHGHAILPSASLIPENDPSLLFTPAGVAPLKPYLLGKKHPLGKRLADSQRCIRTIDIEEVGDDTHLTSFEMLGNWSLNDYFKKEAINLTFDFLTEELGIEPNRLYASVFEGDEKAGLDEESIQIWQEAFSKVGIKAEFGKGKRIQAFGAKDNWWEMEGDGPCGPCSEVFIDTGKPACGPNCNLNCDCGKYIELGNNVFMEYVKKSGKYSKMNTHNVDFGAGLDRLATVSQDVKSIWEVDVYKPIIEKISSLTTDNNEKAKRIIADHIKASTWIIKEGIKPGRTQREYVLRRLIRRAIRQAYALNITENFTRIIGKVAIEQFSPVFPGLKEEKEKILNVLEDEEKKFRKTLKTGLKEVNNLISNLSPKEEFKNSNAESFKIYETYGFPPEMLIEELKNHNISIDEKIFWENHKKAFQKHQKQSRTAAKGLFKGGLLDQSEESVRLHTATHLLLKALYDLLGDHIYQAGSNITPERLRLDFPNPRKLTDEELKRIEDTVNQKIQEGLPVHVLTMKKEEALKAVPYPAFADRYPDVVTVYIIGDLEHPYSKEICTGPHVKNTKELGHFKIIKHESVGAGIRRIKAILE